MEPSGQGPEPSEHWQSPPWASATQLQLVSSLEQVPPFAVQLDAAQLLPSPTSHRPTLGLHWPLAQSSLLPHDWHTSAPLPLEPLEPESPELPLELPLSLPVLPLLLELPFPLEVPVLPELLELELPLPQVTALGKS